MEGTGVLPRPEGLVGEEQPLLLSQRELHIPHHGECDHLSHWYHGGAEEEEVDHVVDADLAPNIVRRL